MNKIKELYKKNKEIINYLIIGVLTTVVSLATYYICVITFLNPNNSLELQIANIISWTIAVLFAYVTNRKYVFESKEKNILKEGLKFASSRLLTLFIDMACMFLFVTIFKINDKIAKLIVQVIITVLNYIISKFLVFNEKKIQSKKLKIIENKYFLIVIIFVIGSLITIPSLKPSYNMDGFCSGSWGYSNYALIFVEAGRYITAFLYYLFGVLHIKESFVSILSIVLSNLFLSIAVYLIYKKVLEYIKAELLEKILAFIASFLICYNPFVIEFFLFEESFVMCGAFLLTIYAANILFTNKEYRFFKSYLILFVASMAYQGILCFYIPYVFLILTIKNKDTNIKENIKNNYLFYIKGVIAYGMSLASSFLTLKIVLKIFALKSQKMGTIDILANASKIIKLMKKTFIYFFNYISPFVFYSVFIIILIILLILTIDSFKERISYFTYVLFLVLFSIIFAFIPNLGMNTLENYTAARMTISIGSIIGFMFIISLLFVSKDNKYRNYVLIILVFLSLSFATYDCYNYLKNNYYGLNRYKNDVLYANEIKKVISDYEKDSNYKIENMYYHIEPTVGYYYTGFHTGYNIRFYAVDWGFSCGTNYLINTDYHIEKMNDDDYTKYSSIELINDRFKYYFDKENFYIILVY